MACCWSVKFTVSFILGVRCATVIPFAPYGSAIIVRTQKNLTSLGMVILLVLKLARHYLFGVVKESAKKAVRVSIARPRANVILVTSKWSSTLNSVRLTLPSVLPGARELEALFKVSIL